jgi:hypothetical protein
MRFLVIAIGIISALGCAALGYFAYPLASLPSSEIEKYQTLLAAALALIGAVLAALAALGGTFAERDVQREVGKATEEAIRIRARGLLMNIMNTAWLMVHTDTDVFESAFAGDRQRATMRAQIETARRALDKMHDDVPKVHSRRISDVVQVLNAMSKVLEGSERLLEALDVLHQASDPKREISDLVRKTETEYSLASVDNAAAVICSDRQPIWTTSLPKPARHGGLTTLLACQGHYGVLKPRDPLAPVTEDELAAASKFIVMAGP